MLLLLLLLVMLLLLRLMMMVMIVGVLMRFNRDVQAQRFQRPGFDGRRMVRRLLLLLLLVRGRQRRRRDVVMRMVRRQRRRFPFRRHGRSRRRRGRFAFYAQVLRFSAQVLGFRVFSGVCCAQKKNKKKLIVERFLYFPIPAGTVRVNALLK